MASKHKFICPDCGRTIFNRRISTCEFCGRELPPELLYDEKEQIITKTLYGPAQAAKDDLPPATQSVVAGDTPDPETLYENDSLTDPAPTHSVQNEIPDPADELKIKTDFSKIPVTPDLASQIAARLEMKRAARRRFFELCEFIPDQPGWQKLTSDFLSIVGVVFILAGITAFFAYNWAELHKFTKFGLIEGGIAFGILIAWLMKIDSLAGKCALFASAFLTGILLAVYGQVYQAGADPYGLFFAWMMLVAGWAVIGRQPGLWLLMAVLANLSLILYWVQVLYPPLNGTGDFERILGPLVWLAIMASDIRLAQVAFVMNAAFLAAWEFLGSQEILWARGRWFPRILACLALFMIVDASLVHIFGGRRTDTGLLFSLAPLWFTLAASIFLWYYLKIKPDLFILAATLFSVIFVLTSFLAKNIGFRYGVDTGWLLSFLVIAQTAGAAWWLRGVSDSWRTAA